MNIETQYLDLLQEIRDDGILKPNRTGTDTLALFSRTVRHDMSEGAPILTTKRVAFKTLSVELEGFIKGITSKKWFQDRGCKIWNEWCNPQKVPYGTDEETQKRMREEDDLGPCIYGSSWRNFHDPTATYFQPVEADGSEVIGLKCGEPKGIDQLANLVHTLKTNPEDRRMICMAWNPLGLKHTALPPCHLGFLCNVLGGRLNMSWWQRSNDVFLGNPFNFGSYGLLLHLLALETGLEEGELVGHLEDVHLYVNHLDQVEEQLRRIPRALPTFKTTNFTSIFDWTHDQTELVDYDPHPAIKAPIAI